MGFDRRAVDWSLILGRGRLIAEPPAGEHFLSLEWHVDSYA